MQTLFINILIGIAVGFALLLLLANEYVPTDGNVTVTNFYSTF